MISYKLIRFTQLKPLQRLNRHARNSTFVKAIITCCSCHYVRENCQTEAVQPPLENTFN